MVKRFRYFKSDGNLEPFFLDPQDIISQLADLFLESSDFSWAMTMMFRKGLLDEKGGKLVLGIDDLIRQIKDLKRQYLERYNSEKVFDEHWQELYRILDKEVGSVRKLMEQLEGLDFDSIDAEESLTEPIERMLGPLSGKDLPEKIKQLKNIESILKTHLAMRLRRLTSILKNYQNHPWTTPELEEELSHLLDDLENISEVEDFLDRHKFKGQEILDYPTAMKLKEEFRNLEALERLLQDIRKTSNLDEIDASELREILGEEAYQAIGQLKRITRLLEEAGFVAHGNEKLELTPKGIREIGQKALRDIFSALKKGQLGKHNIDHEGVGGYLSEDSRPYQFGDPFNVNLNKTFINSLVRQVRDNHHPSSFPLTLSLRDFEIYQSMHLTRSSTVLMLDLSWSMVWADRFLAAKKVAIALQNLIKTQYPRDSLSIVGFYSTARELKPDELPYLQIYTGSYGTNMQAGLRVSSRILAKESNPNKQIIMITDGEPTAHIEDGQLYFQYPPGQDTLYRTLCEVERCTKKGITLTVFMLNDDHYLKEFVNKISLINKGRVFYSTPENLGKYLLVDYISNKRTQV